MKTLFFPAPMTTNPKQKKLLKALFEKLKFTDLPAMSAHVNELIALTNSNQSTAKDLTNSILKDYSLTNKILQMVNSAYYSRGIPVSTVSRAVTVIGFTVVRQLALAIALFEELIKTATLKDQLTKLLSKSFLSATLAKMHGTKEKLTATPEDAFLCALLYNLGEVVILVYLPSLYLSIYKHKKEQLPRHNEFSKMTLNGLTFRQIGKEISGHWNFSETIRDSMVDEQVKPNGLHDETANLKNLSLFSNQLIGLVCKGKSIQYLVEDYSSCLRINPQSSLELVEKSIECSEDTSSAIRSGIEKIHIQTNLQSLIKKMQKVR